MPGIPPNQAGMPPGQMSAAQGQMAIASRQMNAAPPPGQMRVAPNQMGMAPMQMGGMATQMGGMSLNQSVSITMHVASQMCINTSVCFVYIYHVFITNCVCYVLCKIVYGIICIVNY